MPTVLRQLSLIVAGLAAAITLLAGRAAGVRALQLGLRSAAAFAIFFVAMSFLSRGLVALTPDAWSGVRRLPVNPQQLGRRLDITLPGASPADAAFVPLDGRELAGGDAGNRAAEAVQQLAANPEAMARILSAMNHDDQEG